MEICSQHSLGSAVYRTDSIFSRGAIAGCAIWFYLGKLICPVDLYLIYPRWMLPAGALAYLPGAVSLIVLAAAWWKRQTWGRGVLMLIICYVALLLPMLGFVNITYMEFSLVADHWQYVTSIVPCAGIAAGCTMFARRHNLIPVAVAVAVVILIGLALRTRQQSTLYSDAEKFYAAAIAGNPDACVAEYNLATTLIGRGRLREAVTHYERSIKLCPNDAKVQNNFAKTLADLGEFDAAIVHFKRALEINPKILSANFNLASILELRGDFDAAITHFQEELDVQPQFDLARKWLAADSQQRAKMVKALADVREQLRRQPSNVTLLNAGAWIMATSPFESLRDPKESVRLAERAWKLTGGDDAFTLATLAAAYAEAGRFDDAIAAIDRAIRLSAGDRKLVNQLSIWRAQYQGGKPLRDLQMK
jgi:tetratricopeptide (TPR) repeat protein